LSKAFNLDLEEIQQLYVDFFLCNAWNLKLSVMLCV